jgi:hypothetical protein
VLWCCRIGLQTLHIWSACKEFVYDLRVEVLACLTRLTNLQELVVHKEQQGPLGNKAVKLQFSKKVSSFSVCLVVFRIRHHVHSLAQATVAPATVCYTGLFCRQASCCHALSEPQF